MQHHKLLIYTYANNPNELRFARDGEITTITTQGLLESNDGQILRAAALDGMGILVQPSYIVFDDIVAGRLVPVLDAWDLPRLTVNLAYPSRRHLSAKVRTFIDFMVEHFAKMDYERKWTGRFAETGRRRPDTTECASEVDLACYGGLSRYDSRSNGM